MAILEVKDLNFSYEEEGKTIDNVSFSVEEGSYTTIVGHNGSGKSTIAKLIMGLLESASGTITIDGIALNNENLAKIRSRIGIVFQNPDNQFIGATVRDDIAFGLENHCVEPSMMDEIIDTNAALVKMSDFMDQEPTHLSGGQKQRVAIAGVVAMRPDCLILDEATAMLDPRGREQVMQTIHYLNRNMGITVVSITHYMEEAAQADRVLVMSKGHVVMEGTPKEVFSQTEKVRSLHLDVPQAAELRDELVKAGIPMPEGIIDTGACAQALYELLQ